MHTRGPVCTVHQDALIHVYMQRYHDQVYEVIHERTDRMFGSVSALCACHTGDSEPHVGHTCDVFLSVLY